MSDGYAPILAHFYLAPLGTSIASITGLASAIPLAFTDLGEWDLDGRHPFTAGGAPTRNVVRQGNQSRIFFTAETPSDDLPHWDVTFLESNVQVMEAAYGVTIDEDGHFTYFGGLAPHFVFLADYWDGAAVPRHRRELAADVSVQMNGARGGSKEQPLEKWPLQFFPNPNTVQDDGLFDFWDSGLVDAS